MLRNDRIPTMVRNHAGWHLPHLECISQYIDLYSYENWSRASADAIVIVNSDELQADEIEQLRDRGHKIAVDMLWDGHTNTKDLSRADLILSFDSWFWVHEYGFHRYANLDQVKLNCTHTYRAFMPMRHRRHFRDCVIQEFSDLLSDMIWSYHDRALPGDHPHRPDRYFNQSWYDQTCMSVVVETVVDTQSPFPFLTEKTWKPIIFGHPFAMIGCEKSLSWLRDHGFATFGHVFDESYDEQDDWILRIDQVKNIVQHLHKQAWDPDTQERLQHNHGRFFDRHKINMMVRENLIDPLLNLYETRK